MKTTSVILVIIGLAIFFGGLAMDTTETTTTCYETDYSWDAVDSSGCVETTYNNPAPKIAALFLGLSMILGGGGLFAHSRNSPSTKIGRINDPSGISSETKTSEINSETKKSSGETLAEKLREHQNKK